MGVLGLVLGSYRENISWFAAIVRWLEPISPRAEHSLTSIGASIVFCSVLLSPWCNRVLSRRSLVEVGKRCFSLYLVHLPITFWLGISASTFALQRSWSHVSAAAFGAVVSVVVIVPVTELFHRLVDLPAIRVGKRLFR